jgi:deoxyribodipyrimidine photo-lyase
MAGANVRRWGPASPEPRPPYTRRRRLSLRHPERIHARSQQTSVSFSGRTRSGTRPLHSRDMTDTAHAGSDASASLWAEGGRAAALARLAAIDPAAYARTRNHVAGSVTRLSPWLRHGVLSLAEVRDAALARAQRPEDAAKLISELGWRDYWQQVYAAVGSRIHQPIESPAQRHRVPAVEQVPADVLAAGTGLQCIDAFVQKLHRTGWLHNHERMWLASWLVHVRGVRWQAGADWFLSHLIDGDPASNHLSWQWVAGTFSAKPYLFNRENLETFTSGVHCQPCGLRGHCPLDVSYEELASRCFAADGPTERPPLRIKPQAAPAGRANRGDPSASRLAHARLGRRHKPSSAGLSGGTAGLCD